MHTTQEVSPVVRHAVLVCLALVLVACGSGGSTASGTAGATGSTPSASPEPKLSAADLAAVAQLEKRPLKTPAPSPDGTCHDGPFTDQISPYANGIDVESNVYGAGPVYGRGAPATAADGFLYFNVTYFTPPSVKGVVLVRVNDLSGKYQGRFAGPLGVGTSLGTDEIAGQKFAVHSELALPTESPQPNDPAAAPGWTVWHVWQGIDSHFTCAAIQIDTATGTEVILGH